MASAAVPFLHGLMFRYLGHARRLSLSQTHHPNKRGRSLKAISLLNCGLWAVYEPADVGLRIAC